MQPTGLLPTAHEDSDQEGASPAPRLAQGAASGPEMTGTGRRAEPPPPRGQPVPSTPLTKAEDGGGAGRGDVGGGQSPHPARGQAAAPRGRFGRRVLPRLGQRHLFPNWTPLLPPPTFCHHASEPRHPLLHTSGSPLCRPRGHTAHAPLRGTAAQDCPPLPRCSRPRHCSPVLPWRTQAALQCPYSGLPPSRCPD